jgi:MBOAT, membrane-bound O-acyltransferase family
MEMGTQRNLPSPVEYAGYVFSVGTCVFGPWVPFRDYLAIYKKPVFVSFPQFNMSATSISD